MKLRVLSLSVLMLCAVLPQKLRAQGALRVTTRSGLIFEGRARRSKALTTDKHRQGLGKNGNYVIVDTGFRRYFVPTRHSDSEPADQLSEKEEFVLKTKSSGARPVPSWIGSFAAVTPFDENGQRTVTLRTPRGPKTIVQAIKRINADHVWIRSLTHRWEYGMSLNSVPRDVIDRILRKRIDMTDPIQRLRVTRLYMEAAWFEQANHWLEGVIRDFPDRKEQYQRVTMELRQAQAQRLLTELRQRRAAGQHALVRKSLAMFPTRNIAESVSQAVIEIRNEYTAIDNAIDRINGLLGDLEAKLDADIAEKLRPLRGYVRGNLSAESIDRLTPFMNLAQDDSLSPDRKLAVAYSGWLLGPSNAITSLPETIDAWRAKLLVADFLQSPDPLEQHRALDELKRAEGLSPQRLATLLKWSPPREDINIKPCRPTEFQAPTRGDSGEIDGVARYQAVLPTGYTAWHEYPLLVTLRRGNITTEQQLTWWCGTEQHPEQAPRRGYVVIAPEYLPEGEDYRNQTRSHQIVVASVRDALRRFSIDPDRVFLSGHGNGANATFDIAMSRPDLFAGAIPITGLMPKHCGHLNRNGAMMPWYVVGGERHRDSLPHNEAVLDRMVRQEKADVLVCQYKDRGFESYYAEIHNIFDWMDAQTRAPLPKDFVIRTLRPGQGDFFWVEASDFRGTFPKESDLAPPELQQDSHNNRKPRKRSLTPLLVTGRIRGNKIAVGTNPRKTTLRLIEGLIDFSKRVPVEGHKQTISPAPSIDDVLADYRRHADRKRIALQRVEL